SNSPSTRGREEKSGSLECLYPGPPSLARGEGSGSDLRDCTARSSRPIAGADALGSDGGRGTGAKVHRPRRSAPGVEVVEEAEGGGREGGAGQGEGRGVAGAAVGVDAGAGGLERADDLLGGQAGAAALGLDRLQVVQQGLADGDGQGRDGPLHRPG